MSYAGVDVSTLLRAGMRVSTMNHRVIANNIANIETPHFDPVEMDFRKTLRAALEGRERVGLRRTDPRHFEATRNLVDFKHLARSSKNDYNKVDLDNEIMKLNENTSRFDLYASVLANRSQQYRDMLDKIR